MFVDSYNDGVVISGNRVYGNNLDGIDAENYGLADPIVIRGNTVFDNGLMGISVARPGVEVLDNCVYGQAADIGVGIAVSMGAQVIDNQVWGNYIGIQGGVSGSCVIQGNRVYANLSIGISLGQNAGTVRGNVVYSNPVGLEAYVQYGATTIANNVVYANTSQGVLLTGTNLTELINNTIYQPAGVGVRVATSTNVSIRNNIVWTESGSALSVDSASQAGFLSDYNILRATGTGQVADWQGAGFASWTDWRYETGFDEHGMDNDPLLADPDGPDNMLGYVTTPLGPAVTVDDGDGRFAAAGSWTSGSGGNGGDCLYSSVSGTGDTATWTFPGLSPGTYQVAATWAGSSSNSGSASYQVFDGSAVGALISADQTANPNDFQDNGVWWEDLATVVISSGQLSLVLTDNATTRRVVADTIRLQRIGGDCGLDDDFSPTAGSPTLDAGDPDSYYLSEPSGGGGRANVGYTGNTPQALASPAQAV
jgi:hypothetical protein